MTTSTISSGTRSAVGAPAGIETVPVGTALWRVIRPGGEMLGYIDRIATADGDRFAARRMLAVRRRVVPIGEFWRFDEALACFAPGSAW